jgi:UTP-glucose-1-phosphate uridylyltransferase
MLEQAVAGAKELVQVAGKSMLQRTIDEAHAAGVQDVVVVTAPDKPAIAAALSEQISDGSVRLVEQPQPRGLVEALLRARMESGTDESSMRIEDMTQSSNFDAEGGRLPTVVVLLPDNMFPDHPCPIAQVLAAHSVHAGTIIGVIEVQPGWGELLRDTGRCSEVKEEDGVLRIGGIASKRDRPFPLGDATEPRWRTTGRAVLDADFWRLVEGWDWGEGEMDDAPLLNHLADRGALRGAPIPGRFYDVGLPAGLVAARAALI